MMVRCGDLQFEMERLDNGKYRVAVSLAGTMVPGVSTEATELAVLDVAKQCLKLVTENR